MATPELSIPGMGRFRFLRSTESAIFGEGNWVSLETFKGLPPNTILPITIQDDLSTLARERKIPEDFNYRKAMPKPEPRKPVSRGKSKADKDKPATGLMGGFNPFGK